MLGGHVGSRDRLFHIIVVPPKPEQFRQIRHWSQAVLMTSLMTTVGVKSISTRRFSGRDAGQDNLTVDAAMTGFRNL
jgi:hypothetical protein